MTNEQKPAFFRMSEASQILTISRSKLYMLVNAGEIDSVLIGGRNRRIPASALEKYIASQSGEKGGN